MRKTTARSSLTHFTWTLTSVAIAVACGSPEREFSESATSSGAPGASGQASTAAGKSGAAGSAGIGTVNPSVGGASGRAGGSSLGGTAPVAGTTSAGHAGLTGVGGSSAAGGALAGAAGSAARGGAAGGSTGATAGHGGGPGSGGATSVAGAAAGGLAAGGLAGGNGGSSGDSATGGLTATGGVAGGGGWTGTGGAATGGVSNCTPTGAEACMDGVDNDCNGTVDCPVVLERFPEVGRAAAGDDARVKLQIPMLTVARIECRNGKPPVDATIPWKDCNASGTDRYTIYSMSGAEAVAPAGNGVTEFQFRFVYSDGRVSDPENMAYYAHNSLWDAQPGTPALLCPPLVSDAAYFTEAGGYLRAASTTTFAPVEFQPKNPFIKLDFLPEFINQFELNAGVQTVKVLSLRHRFTIDAARQLVLVTRYYKSRRAGSCWAASIATHDRDQGLDTTINMDRFYRSYCDAIVLNKQGSGVCLAANSGAGTAALLSPNSSWMTSILQTLGIDWPKSDPMMWQKLFDDVPGLTSASPRPLQFFSNKCPAEDTVCQSGLEDPLLLPDMGHAYFAPPSG